jgi:hypothetical protein
MSPEVLFGVFQTAGATFADQVAAELLAGEPNATHHVAAQVLAAGGCIWTTNVDVLVERACAGNNQVPPRTGRAGRSGSVPLRPLAETRAGTLVKFHGTAEDTTSLAFTDRQLLTPLPDADVELLAGLARGRHVVVYGYAGADADLADLLEAVLAVASDCVWFEPSRNVRDEVAASFPSRPPALVPPLPPGIDFGSAVAVTAQAFLDHVVPALWRPLPQDAVRAFAAAPAGRPRAPAMKIAAPPALVHARLIERFGSPTDHDAAVRAAFRADARAGRVGTATGYARWAAARSLYSGGTVSRVVSAAASRREALGRTRPTGLRDYVITRQCALLLSSGNWVGLADFAGWARTARRRPDGKPYAADDYYLAHARRYEFRPDDAYALARTAAAGLADALDPERLAGALFEAGAAALLRGRTDDAHRYAFQLQRRRGRYAIRRWHAWGQWLEGTALCHALEPDRARRVLEPAREWFEHEPYAAAATDVRHALLLADRVDLALGTTPGALDLQAERDRSSAGLNRRQRDDRDLVLADLALAVGDIDDAAGRLARVAARPSCPAAAAHAALGLAECDRLAGRTGSARARFLGLEASAGAVGAARLAALAGDGAVLCDRPGAGVGDVRTRGRQRVLWLLTV